jgi:hypothetical protein
MRYAHSATPRSPREGHSVTRSLPCRDQRTRWGLIRVRHNAVVTNLTTCVKLRNTRVRALSRHIDLAG